MKFGDNLRNLRKMKKISQEELSMKVGVSRQSVSKWETGEAYPEMNNILMLCKIFNCNINDLVNDNIIDLDSLDEDIKMSVVKFKKEKQRKIKGISKAIEIIAKIGGILTKIGVISPSGTSESFNPSWKTWIREDITTQKKEVCAKFNGGTVCFSGSDYDAKGYGEIIDNAKSAALVQRFADVGVTCSGSNHITCQEGNLTCTMCDMGYNVVECHITEGHTFINSCAINYIYGGAASCQ